MVTPQLGLRLLGGLGLGDLRAALAFIQAPQSSVLGGLGFSRRQIARSLGVNESTLRGIERIGSRPRQETIDALNRGILNLDLFTNRTGQDRTNVETFVAPDLSPAWYAPRPPTGVTAFRLVVEGSPGSGYEYETLQARSLGSFNVTDEIAQQTANGFRVTRVIWDKTAGAGRRIVPVSQSN